MADTIFSPKKEESVKKEEKAKISIIKASKTVKKEVELTPLQLKIKNLENYVEINGPLYSMSGTAKKSIFDERKSFLAFLKTL